MTPAGAPWHPYADAVEPRRSGVRLQGDVIDTNPSAPSSLQRSRPAVRYNVSMSKRTEIAGIARLVGVPDPGLGVGSSVPKVLFDAVCRRFGLEVHGTMPAQAERIVKAAGMPYVRSAFDSRESISGGGSTVTLEGLQQIRTAVQRLIARE